MKEKKKRKKKTPQDYQMLNWKSVCYAIHKMGTWRWGGQMDDMTVVQDKRKTISIRNHSNESEKGNMLYLNTADHA